MMGFDNFSVVTIRARVEGVILNMHNVNVFTIFFMEVIPNDTIAADAKEPAEKAKFE